jgi:restriction system protein
LSARRSHARAIEEFSLAQIDARDFERRVGAAFRRQGFQVSGFGAASSGGGREAGADLGLVKDGERFLVHCRCWRKLEVGVTLIREFCGLIALQGARGGFVLTCGRFTPEASEFARLSRIRLYDGPRLAQLLELR